MENQNEEIIKVEKPKLSTPKLTTKEYNKLYYQKNKDKTIEKNKVKVICTECKQCVQHWNMSAHKKSKQHKQALIINEQRHEILRLQYGQH